MPLTSIRTRVLHWIMKEISLSYFSISKLKCRVKVIDSMTRSDLQHAKISKCLFSGMQQLTSTSASLCDDSTDAIRNVQWEGGRTDPHLPGRWENCVYWSSHEYALCRVTDWSSPPPPLTACHNSDSPGVMAGHRVSNNTRTLFSNDKVQDFKRGSRYYQCTHATRHSAAMESSEPEGYVFTVQRSKQKSALRKRPYIRCTSWLLYSYD
jgi:hypothetical protein